ncbi:hypothetical protein LTS07_003479 [Exophiala sideris]|uniref:Uncharacterized protein n=1 Tax=Exophiala sideris TaxID=1016849 RepID=A0ABR0JGU3_9EURO|nr:hypothetical protein LTS07_003479 [Exophiala sideris]KAK5042322.1 hypothetical protein LTR13_002128 [Exophiala sideris]KAK5063722.1 hypothetical protein LTR69_003487 [Exophiala sideris]KAK5185589.1 hypothetical protein LTR44_002578 [Eurotiomycetes sp. CCFEE 6388]
MAFLKKTNYIGVNPDDFEAKPERKSSSKYSHLSGSTLLKSKARGAGARLVSGALHGLTCIFSLEYWRPIVSRTKTFVQEGLIDLKTMKWRRNSYLVWMFLWPILPMIALIVVLPIARSPSLYHPVDACQPDSGFRVSYDNYNVWGVSGFFQITLRWGLLSYTSAKIISVCWDIIVGRGGQAVLVIVSYLVYTRALVRSMESSAVSYGTFEAITLQNGSLTSLLKLGRDLLKTKTARARLTVAWMIISGSFVLSFQTLVSAMAGYTANIEAFVQVSTGSMVPYADFDIIRYIVHDAHRINNTLGTDFVVTTGGTNSSGLSDIVLLTDNYADLCYEFSPATTSGHGNDTIDWSSTFSEYADIDCRFYWHVSEYGSKYGFLGLNQTKSTFNHSGVLVELDPPSLNITATFWKQDFIDGPSDSAISTTPFNQWPSGYWWTTASGDRPFHKFIDPTFTNGEFTYSLEEINVNGECQQIQSSYKWGFSFLVLFSVIILFLVWSLGMYILWVDAYLNSRFNRAGRTLGIQRAVLDLAACMQREIGPDGIEMMSNPELQNKIRGESRGGLITYQMLDDKMLPSSRATEFGSHRITRAELWSWVKGHKYTFGLFVCSLGFLAAALAGTHAPLLTAILTVVGTAAATFIGDVHQGRWLIFWACVVFAAVLIPVGPFVYLDRHNYSTIWANQNAYNTLGWWYNEPYRMRS